MDGWYSGRGAAHDVVSAFSKIILIGQCLNLMTDSHIRGNAMMIAD
jgi:hypothetical protein